MNPQSTSASQANRRSLPVVGTDVGRIVGGAGVIACVACCAGVPGMAAAVSALGLGFLLIDRVLLPATIVGAIILLVTQLRSRHRHGRNAPLLLALASTATMFLGLLTSGRLTSIAAVGGAVLLVVSTFADWRLQRRCAAA